MVSLASMPDGSNQMLVSMHPKDLGEVRIRMDRKSDGSVSITVSANEPGTLRSLMSEQAHLHAALDAASVPSTDRQFNFELVGQGAASTFGSGGDAGQAGAQSQNGGQDRPQNAKTNSSRQDNQKSADDGSRPVWNDLARRSTGYFRAGINVTA